MDKPVYTILLLNLALVFLSACQTGQGRQLKGIDGDNSNLAIMQGFGDSKLSSATQNQNKEPMTLEEMSACAKKIAALKTEAMRLQADAEKIEKQKAGFEQKGAALNAERFYLDVKNNKKVAEFNKRIEEMKMAVNQLDNEIDKYNDSTTQQEARGNEFNQACASRPFQDSDIAKLPTELQEALLSNSKKVGVVD